MKKIIIILICLFSIDKIYSQGCTNNASDCENGNGISTNPNNLQNPACPDLKNDFEWRIKQDPSVVSVNPEFYIVYDVNGVPKSIRNPFNNPGNHDYSHIDDNHNSNYQPADGWELLKLEFGALSNFNTGWTQLEQDRPGINPLLGGVKLPYLILYNKYSGTFRFFGTFINKQIFSDVFHIEIKIPKKSNYDEGRSGYTNLYFDDLAATNLLSAQGESVQPLDKESDETQLSIFVRNNKNSSEFFWFDIPVVYDPCICQKRLQLDIKISEVYASSVLINNDQGKGVFQANNQIKLEFNRVLALGTKQKTWPNIDNFSIETNPVILNINSFRDFINIVINSELFSESEKNNLQTMFETLECDKNLEKIAKRQLDFDQIQPLINAEKNFDRNTSFLSTMTSGCFKQNAGLINSDYYKANGSYRISSYPLETIRIALPGSNWMNTFLQTTNYISNGKNVPAYPTYNERLGVFALLKTPSFSVVRSHQANSLYAAQFKILDTLKYTFNPLLNVDEENTKIYVRLVYEGENVPSTQRGYNFEYNKQGKYRLESKFVPIEYFKNTPMVAEIFEQFNSDKVFIQFKIFLTSKNVGSDGKANSSYLFYTFPINLEDKMSNKLPVDQLLNNQGIKILTQNKNFDKNILFEKSTILAYDGKVKIAAKMDVANGKTVKIYSTSGFDIEQGAEINPSIELIVGYPYEKETIPQATFSYINNFCKQGYKADVFAKKSNQSANTEENKVKLFPNPNNGLFYIEFDRKIEYEANLQIVDVTGKQVYNKILNNWELNKYTIDVQNLTSGIYFVKITCGNTKKTENLIIHSNQ